MKFMMFMIPNVYQPGTPADEQAGEGFAPPAEAVEAMMKFNEELAKADALIALDGLHPLTNGARVSFKGETPTVTDGPYIEAKEVIGGYWMIDVASKEEAVEWARKCPADAGDVIEIRQVFAEEDFPEDVRKATDNQAVIEAVERGKTR
ncbi:MAG: YciI family protein [Balneolaceae bacterium]